MINIKNLTKEYTGNGKRIIAIDNISLSINEGEFVSIIGPSGCGKTTLLKVIAGLLEPTKGEVSVSKNSVNRTKRFSIVFQKPVLLPWRNIKQNISLPLEMDKSNITKVNKMINLVGLAGFEHNYPHELSGGMQQRAALARALVTNSKLLLMDEPFGALDELNRDKLNLELIKIRKKVKPTVLFVTHSINEAVFLSDKVVILSDRPARIKDVININLPKSRLLSVKDEVKFMEYVKCIRNKIR